MDDTLTEYRHPELGFTIALPAEIEIREDLPHVALLATEREELLPPEYFRGSLSVLVERGREGWAWTRTSRARSTSSAGRCPASA